MMQLSGNPAIKLVLSALLFLISFNSYSVTEVVTYYHNDALGSPVAATDEQGNVIWREEYEPYGKRLLEESASAENEQFFTGKQEEAELGLQYFGARWYDPSIGRFISMDPVGFQEGNIHSFNRYAYANNNPYRYVDPDGNYPKNVADFALNVTINYLTTGQPGFGAAALDSAVNTLNPFSTATKAAKLGKILYSKSKAGNSVGKKIPNCDLCGPPNKRGNAPVGKDGHPVELHHRNQDPNGPLDEMTRTDHRLGDNFKGNHSNTGKEASKIDRSAWKKEQKQYWKNEWDGGRFDDM